jgi:hypothetical protein
MHFLKFKELENSEEILERETVYQKGILFFR